MIAELKCNAQPKLKLLLGDELPSAYHMQPTHEERPLALHYCSRSLPHEAV